MLKPDLTFFFLDQFDNEQIDLQLTEHQLSSPNLLVCCPIPTDTKAQWESIVELHIQNHQEAQIKFQELKEKHFQWAANFVNDHPAILDEINDLCVEAEWLLEEPVQDSKTYIYDQIAGLGSILGSVLVAAYLTERNYPAKWIDPRDLIITDDNYQNAEIQQSETAARLNALSAEGHILCIGLGVGSTVDNNTTTFDTKNFSDWVMEMSKSQLNG